MPQACNFIFKKRLWHRCFPVNFVKFLRAPLFIEHHWWLLLENVLVKFAACRVVRKKHQHPTLNITSTQKSMDIIKITWHLRVKRITTNSTNQPVFLGLQQISKFNHSLDIATYFTSFWNIITKIIRHARVNRIKTNS